MKSPRNVLVALAAACGLLATLPGAASAAPPGPPGSPPYAGPPAPPYGQPPGYRGAPAPWHGPSGPPAHVSRPADRGGRPAHATWTVVRLVNQVRDWAGCPPARPHPDLMRAARGHSVAMARSGMLSHHEPDGTDVSDRMAEAGYAFSRGAENVAAGPPHAEAALHAWMESPGHRRQIVNCGYDEVGVGVSFAPGGPWWTLVLGSRR